MGNLVRDSAYILRGAMQNTIGIIVGGTDAFNIGQTVIHSE